MLKYSIVEIRNKIKNKEVTIKAVLDEIFLKIESTDEKVGAYLSLTKEYAYKKAEELQVKLDNNEANGELFGVPIAIKDNINMKGTKTTCASKMLENYESIYNATVVNKLEEEGAIIIGKTNMDEFAMGSSTEKSSFKITKNPYDLERVPGGSSGGSAAAVSANMAFGALGSDTGGSIRQPASYCNLIGIKPTYGLVSRYGLVAYASSLDQIGPFAKTVEDAATLLNVISGHDEKDSTSANVEKKDYTKSLVNDVTKVTIGIPTDFVNLCENKEVLTAFNNGVNKLKELGATIKEINLDTLKYSLATYYIIANAEASSNLGRYDGIKYGYRAENTTSLNDIYVKSRTEGFGEEVKRRILMGTYVLSSGYYDAFYSKALKVRTLIINQFKENFKDCDVIMFPTTPNTAFKIGAKSNNATEMYLEDIYTVGVNIAGNCSLSINCGFDSNNMPIGMQIIADDFNEEKMFNVAYTYEQNRDFANVDPVV